MATAKTERVEDPTSVLRMASAARLARADEEDRIDAEWLELWLRALNNFAEERGLTGVDIFLAIPDAPLPQRPPGYGQRRKYCNRCGQRTEMDDHYDALFCRRCNRWLESECPDPDWQSCGRRPDRPQP